MDGEEYCFFFFFFITGVVDQISAHTGSLLNGDMYGISRIKWIDCLALLYWM